jgi:hypothetical protein
MFVFVNLSTLVVFSSSSSSRKTDGPKLKWGEQKMGKGCFKARRDITNYEAEEERRRRGADVLGHKLRRERERERERERGSFLRYQWAHLGERKNEVGPKMELAERTSFSCTHWLLQRNGITER